MQAKHARTFLWRKLQRALGFHASPGAGGLSSPKTSGTRPGITITGSTYGHDARAVDSDTTGVAPAIERPASSAILDADGMEAFRQHRHARHRWRTSPTGRATTASADADSRTAFDLALQLSRAGAMSHSTSSDGAKHSRDESIDPQLSPSGIPSVEYLGGANPSPGDESGEASRLEEFFSTSFPGGPQEEARAREELYREELVHIFQQRVRLLSSITLLSLPTFALMHAIFSPLTRREVALSHLVLLLVCLGVRMLAPRLNKLSALRKLVMGAYVVYFGAAAVISMQLSAPSAAVPVSNQFVALSAFTQIALSILVLPVTLGEAAAIAGFGLASLCATAHAASQLPVDAGGGMEQLYLSHLFSFALASAVVGCLAHLNAVQRRAAFEAAWGLHLSALQLEKLSTLDPVTGGWNRRRIEAVMREEIARVSRFGRHFAVLMFDLDNFKSVNDTRGHAAGDDVLRLVYLASVEAVRETDTVARFGGDEFVVVLPETTRESAQAMAARLRAHVRERLFERWPAPAVQSQVTISLGIITSRDVARPTVSELLAGADERLYDAKRGGKNRVAS